jgi:hypothetical protein
LNAPRFNHGEIDKGYSGFAKNRLPLREDERIPS